MWSDSRHALQFKRQDRSMMPEDWCGCVWQNLWSCLATAKWTFRATLSGRRSNKRLIVPWGLNDGPVPPILLMDSWLITLHYAICLVSWSVVSFRPCQAAFVTVSYVHTGFILDKLPGLWVTYHLKPFPFQFRTELFGGLIFQSPFARSESFLLTVFISV